jgi:hypothetical protein
MNGPTKVLYSLQNLEPVIGQDKRKQQSNPVSVTFNGLNIGIRGSVIRISLLEPCLQLSQLPYPIQVRGQRYLPISMCQVAKDICPVSLDTRAFEFIHGAESKVRRRVMHLQIALDRHQVRA